MMRRGCSGVMTRVWERRGVAWSFVKRASLTVALAGCATLGSAPRTTRSNGQNPPKEPAKLIKSSIPALDFHRSIKAAGFDRGA